MIEKSVRSAISPYRVGTTGRRAVAGTLLHATEHGHVALCGVATPFGNPGRWNPDHPRACGACKRTAKRRIG